MQKTHCRIQHRELRFKRAAKTSRDTLKTKDCYILELFRDQPVGVVGLGECAPIWGLSVEKKEDLEKKLKEVEVNPDLFLSQPFLLDEYPSIRFALEMAVADLNRGGKQVLFPSPFTQGKENIPINGLIWMGDEGFMKEQIQAKIEGGFDCIKLKIGAIDFQTEMNLLASIRKHFSADQMILRVDANGAFSPEDALYKLQSLSEFELHSIEQPIMAKQWEAMRKLCEQTPVPIALDEELIGVVGIDSKREVLEACQPQFIILKPSLVGGFKASEEWIQLAKERNIGWWVTSALESNVGLNAIAQWTYSLEAKGHQGLGTGALFENNFEHPALHIENGHLVFG